MEFDRIFIKDLTVRCILGINQEEREKKQDIVINVVIHADLGKAGLSDDLGDTVDYKSIKKDILRMAESSRFYLIEKLAQEIADICLERRRVEVVTVHIDKPGALRFAKSAALEITRRREDA